MLTVLDVEVLSLLIVPLQLPTLQPKDGPALTWIDAPAVYWPEGQPVELGVEAEGSVPKPVWERVSV
jgi:hypothetical protein